MLDMTKLLRLRMYLPPSERVLPDSNIVYPTAVEGFDWSVRNPLERYFANSSLSFPLAELGISYEPIIWLSGFLIAMVFLSLCILRYTQRNKNASYLLLFGILMCLLSEFFIPIPRYPYYDVQMLLPLLIILDEADASYLASRKINITLILGLLLSIVGFVFVPKALFFAAWLIVLYIVTISIFALAKDSREQQ